jgi:hypothetical protein
VPDGVESDLTYSPVKRNSASPVRHAGVQPLDVRGIMSELQVAHVRQQLSFSMFTDFENFSVFAPGSQHDDAAVVLFDQLESWAQAMKSVRN